ncbi:MAG: peptidylprolyl isomerase [Porticoccus sp.]|jgi:peptidyl-prolyl cis-trans isomerase B (cyclophilin B)
MITLSTNFGDIVIELNFDDAPISSANFLQYCRDGFYADTIFHRVIGNFMIQGGGFDEKMKQKETREPIQNEADNGLSNDIGTLAMARTNDPHSASSQFFINVADNSFLNHTGKNAQGWGYAVFAKVIEGMEVVNKIKAVPTGNNGPHGDVPTESVSISGVSVSDDYAGK